MKIQSAYDSYKKAVHIFNISYFCSMNYFSYVIYNQEYHRFYYGFTDNLKQAEKAHNLGQIDATKDASPWIIVFHEGFDTKLKAIRRSKFYQSKNGQCFIKRELNL